MAFNDFDLRLNFLDKYLKLLGRSFIDFDNNKCIHTYFQCVFSSIN